MISLKVGLFSSNHFKAIVISLINYVKGVSYLSFNYDVLTWLSKNFLHSVNHNVQIIFIEIAKENALLNKRFNLLFGLRIFRNNFGLKSSFLIELAKHLGTDSLPAILLFLFLFLLFLDLSQELSLDFLALFFWFWVKLDFLLVT